MSNGARLLIVILGLVGWGIATSEVAPILIAAGVWLAAVVQKVPNRTSDDR